MPDQNHHDDDPDHEYSEPSEMESRVQALQSVLTQKGYIDPAALNVLIATYQTQVGLHKEVLRHWGQILS